MKKCSKCGEKKELSKFYKLSGKDGYRSACRICTIESMPKPKKYIKPIKHISLEDYGNGIKNLENHTVKLTNYIKIKGDYKVYSNIKNGIMEHTIIPISEREISYEDNKYTSPVLLQIKASNYLLTN